MKLTVFLMVLAIFSSATGVYSQNTRLTLKMDNKRIGEVFDAIEQQSEFYFFYNRDNFDDSRLVTVDIRNKKIDEILNELLKGQDYFYEILDRNILIKPADKSAQQQTSVTGKVTDTAGSLLPGVTVVVKGTTTGTITDANGNYTIGNVPPNATLLFSFVGMRTEEVVVGNQTSIDVIMKEGAIGIEEVVVSALGISREEKKIANAFQKIDGNIINEGANPSMISALAGKIAGANISNSTSLGGSSRIVLRGETSLSGENQPLFVIDGIPIDNSIRASSVVSKVDFGTQVNDIDPDNIESLNVLKGPAAAALYGSRASNGVIIITTKKPVSGSPFQIEFSTGLTFNSILRLPEYQNEYGGGKGPNYEFSTGDGTITNDGQGVNWGDKLNVGTQKIQFHSPIDPNTGKRIPIPWVAYPNNVRDFFEIGNIFSNNLSLSGRSENIGYRFTVTQMNQKGIVPNTDLERINISSQVDAKIGRRVNLSANVNFSKSGSSNLPPNGYTKSLMYNFLWFYRNVPISAVRDYWLAGRENVAQRNFETKWVNNVYFTIYENQNSFDKYRGYGLLKLDYEIAPDLSLMLRSAIDTYYDRQETRVAKGDRFDPNGYYSLKDYFHLEQNHDFLLSYTKILSSNLSFDISFGGNIRNLERKSHVSEVNELNVPQLYSLNNVRGNVISSQNINKKQVNSLYGFANFSFYDKLFVEMTLRNDWSSTLPKHNNSYLYPSVGISTLFHEFFELPDFISFAKLGIAWASVGKDTDPYMLEATLGKESNWSGLPLLYENNTIYNADLKPEKLNSAEINAGLRFFNNRLGLSASYFITDSKNQILSIKIPQSSGYTSKIINAGQLQSRGFELMLEANAIQKKDFKWIVNANWAKNRTKVISLYDGIENYVIWSDTGISVEAREGEYLGNMYGYSFSRTEDGRLIHGNNGLPLINYQRTLQGNYNPDWKLGLRNSFSYKNLMLSFLFDYSYGGDIDSWTIGRGRHAGSLTGTGEDNGVRENGIISPGVILNKDGTYSENTTRVTAYDYYRHMNNYSVLEAVIYDATYLKLRELSISYNIPNSLIKKLPLNKATINLYGNNLFLWSKVDHIDPDDLMQYNGRFLNGLEDLQMPSNRNYGIKLNLIF